MNTFEKYIICHLIGDYLLQNNWMALGKSEKALPLVVHAFIYATVFGIGFLNIYVFMSIFTLHLFLDMGKLTKDGTITEMWLRFIKGRSLKSTQEIPSVMLCSQQATACSLYISFAAVVYCVVDFLMHFIVQYPIMLYILRTYPTGWFK